MRVLCLLGGAFILTVLAFGVVPANGRPLAASRPAAAAALPSAPGDPSGDLYSYPARHGTVPHLEPLPSPSPSPSPSPLPVQAAAPAPRPAPPVPAPAIVIGSTQQALINGDRAAGGLGPLSWSTCLARVAQANAARMAAQGFISHTNGPSLDLACGLGHYAGENVGDWSGGVDDAQLNSMFMASAGHRANILGSYHYVATAWAVGSNGYGYIAVEFA